MDLLVGKSKQKKMCRQCHRTKALNQFLNKNNTSICIICKTCRENQMKRYYLKKQNMKKQLQNEEKSSNNTSADVNPSDNASIPHVNSNETVTTTPSTPTVPSQQWLVLPQYMTVDAHNSSVFIAKVLYHPLYVGTSALCYKSV